MPKHDLRKCSICSASPARTYRVSGLLVRYACDDCFLSRCIHCGAWCVDEQGRILPGVKLGVYHALYCQKCSAENTEADLAGGSGPH